jgi:hypothetical protein
MMPKNWFVQILAYRVYCALKQEKSQKSTNEQATAECIVMNAKPT